MKNHIRKVFAASVVVIMLTVSTALAATDTYIVQKGDSLWKIAVKYQVGLSEIKSSNPQFKNPDLIYPGDKVYVPLPDAQVASIETQVFNLVNKERRAAGLNELKYNWQVARVARFKSEDMRDNKYFSHESPVYGTPFNMLKSFNISYRAAGENIAKGQKTAQAVMDAWMGSPGHRTNILNANFTEIGVGYVEGTGGPYWTQIFIKP
ncbi:MAG: SafA/ExsA family spore coat assembly protein [Oscillospiraceae bacterium]|jgi:uncharacterized YkwD family protein/spore coat assembly protein SafA|nr:SafA/ExsA family spore coat assembly protein [Oscillospiraceae bacterium]